MSDIKKLLQKIDTIGTPLMEDAALPKKFPGYLKGMDSAKDVENKMVGMEESTQDFQFTTDQLKWLGGADRNDPYILARMPGPKPPVSYFKDPENQKIAQQLNFGRQNLNRVRNFFGKEPLAPEKFPTSTVNPASKIAGPGLKQSVNLKEPVGALDSKLRTRWTQEFIDSLNREREEANKQNIGSTTTVAPAMPTPTPTAVKSTTQTREIPPYIPAVTTPLREAEIPGVLPPGYSTVPSDGSRSMGDTERNLRNIVGALGPGVAGSAAGLTNLASRVGSRLGLSQAAKAAKDAEIASIRAGIDKAYPVSDFVKTGMREPTGPVTGKSMQFSRTDPRLGSYRDPVTGRYARYTSDAPEGPVLGTSAPTGNVSRNVATGVARDIPVPVTKQSTDVSGSALTKQVPGRGLPMSTTGLTPGQKLAVGTGVLATSGIGGTIYGLGNASGPAPQKSPNTTSTTPAMPTIIPNSASDKVSLANRTPVTSPAGEGVVGTKLADLGISRSNRLDQQFVDSVLGSGFIAGSAEANLALLRAARSQNSRDVKENKHSISSRLSRQFENYLDNRFDIVENNYVPKKKNLR